jgi:hypothetical protein
MSRKGPLRDENCYVGTYGCGARREDGWFVYLEKAPFFQT